MPVEIYKIKREGTGGVPSQNKLGGSMRVRMLETRRGSEDGIHSRIYEAGKVYDVVPTLAGMWLSSGRCEEDKSLDGPSETKVMEPEKKPEKKIFGTRKKAR